MQFLSSSKCSLRLGPCPGPYTEIPEGFPEPQAGLTEGRLAVQGPESKPLWKSRATGRDSVQQLWSFMLD